MAKRILVGVSGGSASGKTEVARAAARALTGLSALVIAEDDYYGDHGSRPDFDPAMYNFDHPQSRDHALLARQLAQLKAGKAIKEGKSIKTATQVAKSPKKTKTKKAKKRAAERPGQPVCHSGAEGGRRRRAVLRRQRQRFEKV